MSKKVEMLRTDIEGLIEGLEVNEPGAMLIRLTVVKLKSMLKRIDEITDQPSEAQCIEEGPLLIMLDNYEKYLVQLRGGSSSRKLDAAFTQFRDLLDEWISNDT